MPERFEYEIKFSNYPDVVTTKELMVMLDGICEHTALSLLQKGKIKHFRIGNRYRIPKTYVIDFMMSDEYTTFRRKIDCAHLKKIQDKEERRKQKILLLCETPQTRKNLMYLLDVKSKKTFFRVYLNPLLESGELQMIYPEQPSISTQRYIRTSRIRK